MIIVDNRVNNLARFKDLESGDVFIFDGDYFIKAYNSDNFTKANAFDLKDGIIIDMDDNDIITPVNATIIIE